MNKILKIILVALGFLVAVGIVNSYLSTDLTNGQCAPLSKKKEGECVQGKIYVEYSSGVTLSEVSKLLAQNDLIVPEETVEYWSLPKLTLWDIENLETYSQESVTDEMMSYWNRRLSDEVVERVTYLPVGREQATLKVIIDFKDGVHFEEVSQYVQSNQLTTYISVSLESSWSTGGKPQNWSYLDVPDGQEQFYVDLLKDDSLFSNVELYIFSRPGFL